MDDNIIKRELITRAMTEVECHPVIFEETAIQEYTKVPIAQLSALGATFASIAPALKNITQVANSSGAGEKLFRMIIPNGVHGAVNSVGNITNSAGKIVGRARFQEVGSAAGAVANVNPAIMLMAVAISCVTKKLESIEEVQKDIIEFLQLKEKAMLKGNVLVLQEIMDEYKYNWDNEKYKNNKHIQVQEIKRDAEQSIIFSRDQIAKKGAKKGLLHSDRDVRTKIQKVQDEFKDYELALYMFSFSSFLEVMLLENFDEGYLNSVSEKIKLYAGQYHELYEKCYEQIETDSKTSIQAHVIRSVAGLNKVMGKTIAKIPKVRDGQVDENLIAAGDKVDAFNEKRTETTMELFSSAEATCVNPFVDNIQAVNKIYNQPMEMLFDDENVYFSLAEAN